MKNIGYIFLSALLIAMTACDLTENPKAEVGRDIVFGSETGLQNYVYGFYNYLPDYGTAHRINITLDNAAKNSTSTYEVGAYTTNTSTSWDWTSIRNVNYFLKYNVDESLDESVRNHYTGIARFFRAYLYYDKLVQYGEVPWIDEPLEPDSPELYQAQDSRDLIITNIIEDLDYAYENITTTDITANSNTINKWTALLLKSRVCLFEGSFRKYHANGGSTYGDEYLENCSLTADYFFEEAADAAGIVINQGPYSLHTTSSLYTNDGRGAYRDLFISDDPVTEEVMLALSLDAAMQLGEANWYYNSSTYGPHLCMTRNFAKTYLNLDGSVYDEKNSDGTYKNFIEETTDRDYRLNQTIRGHDYTCMDQSGTYVPTSANMAGHSLTGYQFTKYVLDDVSIDNGQNNYNDVPLARYAEVLLNYAEAKAELGTITDADWSITIGALRRRAGITGGDLDNLPTVVDPHIQSLYPNVSDPIILEIRREREIELILEGLRLDDLKRWACGEQWESAPWDGIYISALDTPIDLNGDGEYDVYVTEDVNYSGDYSGIIFRLEGYQEVVQLTDDPNNGYKLNNTITRVWNDNMYIYPIPEIVIQINPALAQNPGW